MIGASIESQAQTLLRQLAIPKYVIGLTTVSLKANASSVTRSDVLPVFLPETQKLLKNAEFATEERLTSTTNAVMQYLPAIWNYVQLIDPTIVIPDDSQRGWTFNNITSYEQRNVVMQYWNLQLWALLADIDKVYQQSICVMTQLALMCFQFQPQKSVSVTLLSEMATRMSVIDYATDQSSLYIHDAFITFSKWFGEQTRMVNLEVASAIINTPIYLEMQMEEATVRQQLPRLKWLGNALLQMPMHSMHSWYSQLSLTGPWLYSVLIPMMETDYQQGNGVILPESVPSIVAAFKTTKEQPESVKSAKRLYKQIRKPLAKNRTYTMADIPFIANIVAKLISDIEIDDDEKLKLDSICKSLCGYDVATYSFLTEASAELLSFELEQVATIGRPLAEIQDAITKAITAFELASEALEAFQLDQEIPVTNVAYKQMLALFEDNIRALVDKADADEVQRIYEMIWQKFVIVFGYKPATQDQKTFASLLFSQIQEYYETRQALQTLEAEKKEQVIVHERQNRRKLQELKTQIDDIEKRIKTIQDGIDRDLVQVIGQTYNARAMLDTANWYKAEGRSLRTSKPPEFKKTIRRQYPFNGNDGIIDDTLMYDILNRIDSLFALREQHNQQLTEHELYFNSTRKTLFWYKWFIFGILGMSVILAVGAWYFCLRSVPLPDASGGSSETASYFYAAYELAGAVIDLIPGAELAQSAIAGVGVLYNLAPAWNTIKNFIPLGGYLRSVADGIDQNVLIFWSGLTWELIDPNRIYTSLMQGGAPGASIAFLFWSCAIQVGWTTINMSIGLSNVMALSMLRRIDSSPMLQWDEQIAYQWTEIGSQLRVTRSTIASFTATYGNQRIASVNLIGAVAAEAVAGSLTGGGSLYRTAGNLLLRFHGDSRGRNNAIENFRPARIEPMDDSRLLSFRPDNSAMPPLRILYQDGIASATRNQERRVFEIEDGNNSSASNTDRTLTIMQSD